MLKIWATSSSLATFPTQAIQNMKQHFAAAALLCALPVWASACTSSSGTSAATTNAQATDIDLLGTGGGVGGFVDAGGGDSGASAAVDIVADKDTSSAPKQFSADFGTPAKN